MKNMLRLMLLALPLLGGCAETAVMGKAVSPPPAYLMASPVPFPTLHKGDDAAAKLAEAAVAHSTNVRRLRALQRYVRIIRRD